MKGLYSVEYHVAVKMNEVKLYIDMEGLHIEYGNEWENKETCKTVHSILGCMSLCECRGDLLAISISHW